MNSFNLCLISDNISCRIFEYDTFVSALSLCSLYYFSLAQTHKCTFQYMNFQIMLFHPFPIIIFPPFRHETAGIQDNDLEVSGFMPEIDFRAESHFFGTVVHHIIDGNVRGADAECLVVNGVGGTGSQFFLAE